MSLNAQQRKQTSDELHANFELSGLTMDEVQSDLCLSPRQLARTFAVSLTLRPQIVWQLRDYLESTIRLRGGEPRPYTFLREDMRASAEGWFKMAQAVPGRPNP